MNNTVSDVSTLIDPLKEALVGSITPAQLVTVLAGIVGVGMMFVLMWFGARKLKTIFTSAVTSGKIKF